MNSSKFIDYLGYEIDDEPSDFESDDKSESSSDEIERDYQQFLKEKRSKTKTQATKLADDFENEMNQQLDTILDEQKEKYLKNDNQSNETDMVAASTSKIMYEEEEDTDSEEEFRTGERCTRKKQKFTNDELFYDPDMDDDDQNWINKQRKTSKKLIFPKKKVEKEKNSIDEETTSTESNIKYLGANSDAVLNCPCCMINICYDCQRHDKFKTQYRAMFVFNCKINQEEILKYPKNEQDKKKYKKKNSKFNKMVQSVADIEINEPTDESIKYDLYRPVNCSNCNTEIGVYEEKEEIYHFFNVLSSHS